MSCNGNASRTGIRVIRVSHRIASRRYHIFTEGNLLHTRFLGFAVIDIALQFVERHLGTLNTPFGNDIRIVELSAVVACRRYNGMISTLVHTTVVRDDIVTRLQGCSVSHYYRRSLVLAIINEAVSCRIAGNGNHCSRQRLLGNLEGCIACTGIVTFTCDSDCCRTCIRIITEHNGIVGLSLQFLVAVLHGNRGFLLRSVILHTGFSQRNREVVDDSILLPDTVLLLGLTFVVALADNLHLVVAYLYTTVVRESIVVGSDTLSVTVLVTDSHRRLLQFTRIVEVLLTECEHAAVDSLLLNLEGGRGRTREVVLTCDGNRCRTCIDIIAIGHVIAHRRHDDIGCSHYLADTRFLLRTVVRLVRQLVQRDSGILNAQRQNVERLGNRSCIVVTTRNGYLIRRRGLIHVQSAIVHHHIVVSCHCTAVSHRDSRFLYGTVIDESVTRWERITRHLHHIRCQGLRIDLERLGGSTLIVTDTRHIG